MVIVLLCHWTCWTFEVFFNVSVFLDKAIIWSWNTLLLNWIRVQIIIHETVDTFHNHIEIFEKKLEFSYLNYHEGN